MRYVWSVIAGILLLGALATLGFLYAPLRAQEPCQLGDWLCDHDKFHKSGFYPNLIRDRDKFGCCSDADCRPSQVRIQNGQYEVMVDRKWCPFDESHLAQYRPPKGISEEHPKDTWSTAHVCSTDGRNLPGCPHIYCVRLPNLM